MDALNLLLMQVIHVSPWSYLRHRPKSNKYKNIKFPTTTEFRFHHIPWMLLPPKFSRREGNSQAILSGLWPTSIILALTTENHGVLARNVRNGEQTYNLVLDCSQTPSNS